jgi:hypothetical protein
MYSEFGWGLVTCLEIEWATPLGSRTRWTVRRSTSGFQLAR